MNDVPPAQAAQLLDTVEQAVIATDLQGRITFWNRFAERLYGWCADEVLGRSIEEVTPSQVSREQAASIMDRLRSGQSWSGEFQVKRRDGTTFPALVTDTPIRDQHGQLVGIVGVSSDVTERNRMQADLAAALARERVARAEAEAQRTRLREVLEVLPEAVLIADRATQTFVLSNPTSESLLGPNLVGARVPCGPGPAFGSRRFDGTPIPADELPLQRALRGESVRGAQFLLRDPSEDRDVPVLVNSTPLHDAAGRVVAAVAVFQDISDIRDLDQQKDAFLATVSHDLQQPLAVIKGRSQLIRRRLAADDALDRAGIGDGLRSIETTVDQMAEQVAELLDAARLQMGRPLELEPRRVDLVGFVQQVAATWQDASPGHRVHFETPLSALASSVDPARLRRVLANLLSNAVKYSPSGCDVTVRLAREADPEGRAVAVLAVEDHGVGIPAADLPHVFERFYRARNASQSATGTGIGLAGTGQIVEQHGGTIEVSSVEGQGSTFTVRLPLEERAFSGGGR